jgi:3-methyladenine DNA glycosylase AlkD
MDATVAIARLKALADPRVAAGLPRFGVHTRHALGLTAPQIRGLAREIGTDHSLALALWRTGIHEARILASLIDDPARVTETQMERWARDFDSWALCDACCYLLFDRTPYAHRKAAEWSWREEEYVKRGAFALMAGLAIHDKQAGDVALRAFLPIIRRESTDERNFVRKAVNWALRQIGKRNRALNRAAIATAERIRARDSKAAHWIAADALRELRSAAVQRRLQR